VTALAVDPATPTTLYAATSDRGVFRSTDGGVTGAEVNAGLSRFANLRALDLAVDPAVPHLVYAIVEGAILANRLTAP